MGGFRNFKTVRIPTAEKALTFRYDILSDRLLVTAKVVLV
jgi:hypothetical protein